VSERMKNWRRNAVLASLPIITPGTAQSQAVRTPWKAFWRRFRRQHIAMIAGAFILLLIVAAMFAPWLVPFDPENYFDYDRLNEGPSLIHWLGVDSLGRDIFSRILMGTRISLTAGVLSVVLGAAIGTVSGLLAGYYEGWWDRITMRVCDVLFAFPGILLAIAVVGSNSKPILNRRAVSAHPTPRFCSVTFCRARCHQSWCISPCVSAHRLSPLPACRSSEWAHSLQRRSGARCSTRPAPIWSWRRTWQSFQVWRYS